MSRRFTAVVTSKERPPGKPANPIEANGKLHVLLYDAGEGGECVNAQILAMGLGRLVQKRVVRGPAAQKAYEELEKYELEARGKRLNLWEYGDPGDSDDAL